jgi:hypothetical protein
MSRRSSRLTPLAGLLVIATGLALPGCTPFHTTRPVQIEVVDGLTGQPARDVKVGQMVATTKFERELRAVATSDAHGSLVINAIDTSRDSYWWVGRDGPTYIGHGGRRLPSAFRQVQRDDGTVAFIAPAWPTMNLRIALPEAFKGPVVVLPSRDDVPHSSGWMPRATVAADDTLVAVSKASIASTPGSGAHLAYPTSIGGVPGFGFKRNAVLLRGHTPLRIINAGSQSPTSRGESSDPSATFAWEIYLAVDSRGERDATALPFEPDEARMWFVGTEAELHAWLDGAQLKPTDAMLTSRDPLAGRRQVTWASALPMLRRSWTGQLSDEPEWTTQAKVRAEYEALVVQASEPAAR